MRARIAHLSKSKTVLAVLVATIVLAVAGTTVGYAALQKEVTLSLDGKADTVNAMGGTVGEVLEAQGIELGDRDFVAPAVDEQVEDGSRITVRFARPLELAVDGKEKTYWVTATEVADALTQIGRRFSGADLSTSRGASISRDGMRLEVVTPKTLKVKLGSKDLKKHQVTALTVKGALKELGVKVGKHDQVKPGLNQQVVDGDRVVLTDIRIVTKRDKSEAIDFETVQREDSSMLEGETETARSGRDGVRDVTYRLTYRNGELVATKVVRADVLRQPVNAVVKVGTKEEAPAPAPAPAPAANYASGGTVWDALAQCESGGNWAINTGNGYYGGLQFNLSTWQSYGGPGMPHEQSRETQIAIAEKVRAATGGYGSWPACSASLGLPQ